jgi:iron complex transport system ATP-binding protein
MTLSHGVPPPGLAAQDVTVRADGHTLVDSVSFQVDQGELVAVVGPNGAGKTTLAAVLSGERRPDEGQALIDGTPVTSLPRRELARRRAVLPQGSRVAFPFRTEQVVMMGRYPRLPRGHLPGPADRDAVAAALHATDTTHLVGRLVPTLSGGEQARVALARVLAQDTACVILDEPSASLDLQHQQRVLDLCLALAAEGRTVLAIVHDLNHAAVAHRVAVLHQGRLVGMGPPAEVLTPGTVWEVFGVAATVTTHPDDDRPLILPARPTAETIALSHPTSLLEGRPLEDQP